MRPLKRKTDIELWTMSKTLPILAENKYPRKEIAPNGYARDWVIANRHDIAVLLVEIRRELKARAAER